MKRLLAGILAGGMALTVGCDGTEPASLHVSMTATPAEFRLGEETTIRLVVVNVGTTDQHVSSSLCFPRFSVRNTAGEEVQLAGRVCSLRLEQPVLLAPGDTLVLDDTWDGRRDAGALGDDPPNYYVAPGVYLIAPTGVHDDARGNAIAVTVLPPIE
jgi:hypothetical protein